jgi:hypothetical protein
MKIYKNNIIREIQDSDLEKYLAADWKQSQAELAEEIIDLKPPARVKAAVKTAEDNAITSKGE